MEEADVQRSIHTYTCMQPYFSVAFSVSRLGTTVHDETFGCKCARHLALPLDRAF